VVVSDVVISMGLVAELTPTSGVICQRKRAKISEFKYPSRLKNEATWLRGRPWVSRSSVRAGTLACKVYG